MPIKRALLSVYDKTNLYELANFLAKRDIEIIATTNTYEFLCEQGIAAKTVSTHTSYEEIISGRVKTLHPKIHGGILAKRTEHTDEMRAHDISPIDLVVVNLYPFAQTIVQNRSEDEIIEHIDIGGVALLRSAAKNYTDVCVLTDIEDYSILIQKIRDNAVDISYRKALASKAFALTANYDSTIYQWFSTMNTSLPSQLSIRFPLTQKLRSGENPHQQGGFYGSLPFTQLHGKELSYNNILDAEVAYQIVSEFTEPGVAIIKHNNPCGTAISSNIMDAYSKALACDPQSSFGGVIGVNKTVDENLATKINETFTEVVIAPDFSEQGQVLLCKKKNLRLLSVHSFTSRDNDLKSAFGGVLVQQSDNTFTNDFKIVTQRAPNPQEWRDLLFAWKVCKYVKSNAIVLAKNKATLGIGAGQMSRINSVHLALRNLPEQERGVVMASDGFFPFADSITAAGQRHIAALIQPGGSMRDNEVIAAANVHNIAMVFTQERHFRH